MPGDVTLWVDRSTRALSFTDLRHSFFDGSGDANASSTWGGCSSNETATRKPRPGTKSRVGAVTRSTSTSPDLGIKTSYSSRGDNSGGVTLAAVTGKTHIPEAPRP